MTAVARKVGGFVLLVIVGILLLKLIVGAVVGFAKMIIALALVAVFAAAAVAVLRR